MWLLPLFPPVAGFATRIFYRVTISDGGVPADGPLLLVGNHPNSLLDPLFLAAVAGRPVRFLAKAPLFSNLWTAWAVKAAGAIPVYRPRDNPALVGQNADMFRAARDALVEGAAIGIFPEGMSHDGPSLVPIRTGAARIALGARAALGRTLPIVPVGLVLRNKEEFRSDAHIVVGEPVDWAAVEGDDTSATAVKELTARMDAALRGVTLNLEKWEDSPLIATAEEIYVAERVAGAEEGTRVDRWREAAQILSDARRAGDIDAVALAAEIGQHRRILDALDLRPRDLHAESRLESAVRWTVSRVALPLEIAVAWLGAVLFWPPYRLTKTIANRAPADLNSRASVKLVAGGALFLLWIVILTTLAWTAGGWRAGLVALALLPVLALATLALLEKSVEAWTDARRFFLLRSRTEQLDALRARQGDIAQRLRALRDRASGAVTG